MSEAMLDHLEALLREAAREGRPMSYRDAARRLEVEPPHTIHKTTELLEALMRRHAAAGEPQLASMVVSLARGGMPAPGFFMLLQELGVYEGSVDGDDARRFHEREMQRCHEDVAGR